MPNDKRRINPLLLILAIILCLSSGFIFKRTTFDPDYKIPEHPHASTIKAKVTPTPVITQRQTAVVTTSATPAISDQPTNTPVETSVSHDSSPEASKGTWTSSGSNWQFMVDGVPYTGWLIDTDGNHYYFNKDGIMQTEWLDDNGKRYYMDLDGIMQTGQITVDGKKYELQADGSLKK